LGHSMTESNNVSPSGETKTTDAAHLKLAGWLSITNGILTIPISAMSVFLVSQPDSSAKLLNMILGGVSFILFIFVFLSLKGLLNARFGFHDTDIFITMLIWLNALSLAFPFLELFPALDKLAEVVPLVLTELIGIVLIIFGIRLLRVPDTLHGLLKPFVYTSIATGVCFVSIVLMLVGLLVGIAADIILGVIFLRFAESGKDA